MKQRLAMIRVKSAIADILGSKTSFSISDRFQKLVNFPFIRVVGYHDTPKALANKFRMHLNWYAENYINCDQAMLDRFLLDGIWSHSKPGLIISFDDGLRSNSKVAASLLEEYGFTGWFMVPAFVPELGNGMDRKFAVKANISYTDEDPKGRLFMSWDDLHMLSTHGHEICCHSMHHKRLGEFLTPLELKEEIYKSRAVMESILERPIDSFAWVGGEDYSYSKAAFEEMQSAGYKRIFSTNCYPILPRQTPFCLERNHVSSNFNINEVRLSIGGFYDLLYYRKRARTNRVLGLNRP
ncbi:MAG TPA: polysaccharide deacetylase family protein [Smithellaceae bacterium]|nr:polysaccharide deacetylase family protein [Smithellaceae bacterium]